MFFSPTTEVPDHLHHSKDSTSPAVLLSNPSLAPADLDDNHTYQLKGKETSTATRPLPSAKHPKSEQPCTTIRETEGATHKKGQQHWRAASASSRSAAAHVPITAQTAAQKRTAAARLAAKGSSLQLSANELMAPPPPLTAFPAGKVKTTPLPSRRATARQQPNASVEKYYVCSTTPHPARVGRPPQVTTPARIGQQNEPTAGVRRPSLRNGPAGPPQSTEDIDRLKDLLGGVAYANLDGVCSGLRPLQSMGGQVATEMQLRRGPVFDSANRMTLEATAPIPLAAPCRANLGHGSLAEHSLNSHLQEYRMAMSPDSASAAVNTVNPAVAAMTAPPSPAPPAAGGAVPPTAVPAPVVALPVTSNSAPAVPDATSGVPPASPTPALAAALPTQPPAATPVSVDIQPHVPAVLAPTEGGGTAVPLPVVPPTSSAPLAPTVPTPARPSAEPGPPSSAQQPTEPPATIVIPSSTPALAQLPTPTPKVAAPPPVTAAEADELRQISALYAAAQPPDATTAAGTGGSFGWQRPPGHVVFPAELPTSDRQPAWLLYHGAPVLDGEADEGSSLPGDGAGGRSARGVTCGDYQDMFGHQDAVRPAAAGSTPSTLAAAPHERWNIAAPLASQAVLLRDPLTLLASEHLLEEAPGTESHQSLQYRLLHAAVNVPHATEPARGDDLSPAAGDLRRPFLPDSTLKPAAPSGEVFCRLTYPAKVLLSAILYIRALGGFPTLLRAGPLTDASPIIDRKNCVELVFWNPASTTTSAPPATAAMTAATHHSSSSVFRHEQQQPVSAMANWLPMRSASVSTTSGLASSLPPPPARSELSLHLPTTTAPTSASTAVLQHAMTKTERSTNDVDVTPRTCEGRELNLSDAGVPRMAAPFTARRKTSLTLSSQTDAMTVSDGKPPANTVSTSHMVSSAPTPDGRRLSQLSFHRSGAPTNPLAVAEPPSNPMGRGKPLIKKGEDELCVVLRAVLAKKSTVHRFGTTETVHVLPPLSTEEEDFEKQLQQQIRLGGLELSVKSPLLTFLSDNSVKLTAVSRRKAMLEWRKQRQAAQGSATMNTDGSTSADDYGDLVVALLLSGEASELTGNLPDAVELAALRYRIFSLQGYCCNDPYGIHRPDPRGGGPEMDRSRPVVSSFPPSALTGVPSFTELLSRSVGMTPKRTEDLGILPFQATTLPEAERLGQRRAQERTERYVTAFPIYRASSVAESSLQTYQEECRRAAKVNRRPSAHTPEPLSQSCDPSSRSKSAKQRAMREAEKELARFRPLNLNGFYRELSDAVQYALDTQLRQTKEKVMQAFHM